MAYEKDENNVPIKHRIFTDKELEDFDKELKVSFLITVTLANNEKVTYIDFDKYHKHRGTLNKVGEVVVNTDLISGEILTPIPYERLENKIRQYKYWVGKKEFGKTKSYEQLGKVSLPTIKADEIDVDEIPF